MNGLKAPLVFVSQEAHPLLLSYLKAKGLFPFLIEPAAAVYRQIAHHADIRMCILPGCAVADPALYCDICSKLDGNAGSFSKSLLRGKAAPGSAYPDTASYNGAVVGRYFIHNLDYTDSALLETVLASGLTPINVKQGYSRCSLLPVDESSAITSDLGIAKAFKKANTEKNEAKITNAADETGEDIDIDLSSPFPTLLEITSGYVELPGFSYGFIGGAAGRVGDEIIFHGDLSAHPDFVPIVDFIEERNLKAVYFKEFPLRDIGSILTSMQFKS